MGYDFTVLVVTYYSDREKLLETLNSIVAQKDVSFEIVIADDGSDVFYRQDICDFMAERGFTHYQIVENAENHGTVCNLLSGLEVSRGKYVKTISPGDYLYDDHTLSKLCSFMQEHDAKVLFADLVYYSYEDGRLTIYPHRDPWDDSIYLPDRPYSQKKVLKHELVYSDTICGAGTAFETELFRSQLKRLEGTVIYAEDAVIQLMALQGHRVWKYPGIMVWYEYGSGISTNSELGFGQKITQDFYNFTKWLTEHYGEEPYVRRAWKKWQILIQNDRKKYLQLRLQWWDMNLFSMRRRLFLKNYRLEGVNEDWFYAFHDLSGKARLPDA